MKPEQSHFDLSTKEGLVKELDLMFTEVVDEVSAISEHRRASMPSEKWSVGRHVNHLVKSVKPVLWGLRIPHWALLPLGKQKQVRTLSELIADYNKTLEGPAKAPLGFRPAKKYSLQKDIKTWRELAQPFLHAVEQKTEQQLNTLRLIHPGMGLISMRDMLLFTLYHTRYHLYCIHRDLKSKEE